jgi:hypothetical protein
VTKYVEKAGEVVAIKDADLAAYQARGYTETTATTERDPRDAEGAVGVQRSKSTLRLGSVLAAAPAGPNVVGELYVATGGVLKICTVAGSPGTWVSVGAQT